MHPLCYLLGLLSFFVFYSLAQQGSARILIYSATKGFRHDSIPTAIQALKMKGSSINVVFDNTEDETQFNGQVLAQYDALLFLDTTGQVLDDSGTAALQNYLNLGGNFVGVHAASDCLNSTTFYGQELGAYFDYHPALQNATVDVIDSSHPSTSMLPAEWHVQDEMYNFKSDPRANGAIVVLSANESSYNDPGPRLYNQGTPHPTAWYQDHGAGVQSNGTAGRSFYTSLGHLNETWQDELFLAHVTGGITWTLLSNTTRAFNKSALVGNAQSSSQSSTTPSGTSVSSKPTSSSSDVHQQLKPFDSRVTLSVFLATVFWYAYICLQDLV
ncbi:hypothetical protein SERLA73DRAFT_181885 [Serpula lacrymans var. lacrymans S7.3]|uniref:ThuA-like domain-containing protein n=2 Tax=Serpula lacrymans var. lacrymans TaxID=341189 RepID=F8PYW8_SERL3|nr:uncharacterized protein SERLADRAFT_468282 [Serpula lacrymans var. lacrymans S7.9]EGN99081.1 hypothetical protein SERLA73DRAFT_181885 [Serpula lacrymans var. lacrymans S7.3]EGO24655.1 hypothetical protein SERLADRAFT_468282 [Serpula lacrymans var. lacrymans S7.9]